MFDSILGKIRKGSNEKKDKEVILTTISRTYDDEGLPEYIEEKEKMKLSEIPDKAVHITGKKCHYALIDMEPNYPDYASASGSESEDAHNWIDASGYYLYFMDPRLNRGFEALGQIKDSSVNIEPRKIIIIAVAAIVGIWFVSKMMTG